MAAATTSLRNAVFVVFVEIVENTKAAFHSSKRRQPWNSLLWQPVNDAPATLEKDRRKILYREKDDLWVFRENDVEEKTMTVPKLLRIGTTHDYLTLELTLEAALSRFLRVPFLWIGPTRALWTVYSSYCQDICDNAIGHQLVFLDLGGVAGHRTWGAWADVVLHWDEVLEFLNHQCQFRNRENRNSRNDLKQLRDRMEDGGIVRTNVHHTHGSSHCYVDISQKGKGHPVCLVLVETNQGGVERPGNRAYFVRRLSRYWKVLDVHNSLEMCIREWNPSEDRSQTAQRATNMQLDPYHSDRAPLEQGKLFPDSKSSQESELRLQAGDAGVAFLAATGGRSSDARASENERRFRAESPPNADASAEVQGSTPAGRTADSQPQQVGRSDPEDPANARASPSRPSLPGPTAELRAAGSMQLAAVRRALADVPDIIIERVEIGRWEAAAEISGDAAVGGGVVLGRGHVLLVPMDSDANEAERSALQLELQDLLRTRLPDMAPMLPPVMIPPLPSDLPFDLLDSEPDSAWLESPLLPAIRKHMLDGVAAKIMAVHSNVCAVFVGPKLKSHRWTSDPAVTVVVMTKGFIPSGERRLDETVPGVPVDVVEGQTVLYTANIYSVVRPSEQDPLAGGMSIGRSPTDPTAPGGTLGLIVEHTATGVLYGLTCSHVAGRVGEKVFAPAARDVKNTERPTQLVGIVTRSENGEPYAVTLRDGQVVSTYVDAALIELSVDGTLITPAELPYRKQGEGDPLPAQVSPGATGVWTLNDAILEDFRQPKVIKVGRSTGTSVSKLHDGDLRGNRYRFHLNASDYLSGTVTPETKPAGHTFRLQADLEPRVLSGLYLVPSGSLKDRKRFARAGDSGAIVQVFGPGISPRVAGMVLGGMLLENGLYWYTIVAPIDPILENFGVRLRG